MSQSQPQGASVEQSASTRVAINSDDPAWAHCYCPDPKKKYSLICNYCTKTMKAGITRVKYHLACVTGFGVCKCDKVPTDVKEEMLALINKKTCVKEQKQKEKKRARDVIDLDHSEGEMCSEDSDHGNEVIVLKSSKGPSHSVVSSSGSGSIKMFYKPASIEEAVQKNQKEGYVSEKVQSKLTTQKREEQRDRAVEYICQFFYEASIAHNSVLLPSFSNMLEAIGAFGRGLRGPSPYEMRSAFLYAHTRLLDLMRKYLGKDLVRSGVTRFATAYLNLKSLQDNKKELKRLFRDHDLNEMGYLKNAKGKKAEKVVNSEAFWKNVDIAVNFFEPLAIVLRRMDSDVPAMGFLHGYLLEAKREIAVRFDNDEEKYKPIWEIIDKRWDSKLKSPLHLAGYYLNPYYYYPNKANIEKDGSFRAAVIECITTLIEDEEIQDEAIEELSKYQEQQGSFGYDAATRRRRNKDFNPATWWLNHGTCTPNLRLLAIKILSLTCSSSACERNWSSFESVHTKKRSRLLHERMRDLIFVKFNSILRQKKEKKGRDPLEKEINVLEDDNNEFITGEEPNASPEDQECTEPSAKAQDASTSQAKAKRMRAPRPRKKFRTLSSLMTPQSASSASESEENQDVMVSTDAEDD